MEVAGTLTRAVMLLVVTLLTLVTMSSSTGLFIVNKISSCDGQLHLIPSACYFSEGSGSGSGDTFNLNPIAPTPTISPTPTEDDTDSGFISYLNDLPLPLVVGVGAAGGLAVLAILLLAVCSTSALLYVSTQLNSHSANSTP